MSRANLTDESAAEAPGRLRAAFAAFDAANAKDRNLDRDGSGQTPRELLYARRMSEWLGRLYPEASEALRLAARCQHIERWRRPREDYPQGRTGYLVWRRDLQRFHAERAGEILREAGYPDETVRRVQALVRKERLKQDLETQALEDTVCLVFLDHYFQEFAAKHADEKVIDILRKTWRKMSPRGRNAVHGLSFSDSGRRLVEAALASQDGREPSSSAARGANSGE